MKQRVAIVLASLLITAGLGWLAFALGSWGFDTRRYLQHQGRLKRMLEQKPVVEQVVEGLRNDGSPLVAAPRDPATLHAVARARGGPRQDEVIAKGMKWAQTRVFQAGDMVYFIYFDADGVMRDYVCVSR
jgi:hypothetical protein